MRSHAAFTSRRSLIFSRRRITEFVLVQCIEKAAFQVRTDSVSLNEDQRRQIIADRRRRRWRVIQFLFLLCGVALLFRAYAGESAFKAVLGIVVSFAALSAHRFAYLYRMQQTRARNGSKDE